MRWRSFTMEYAENRTRALLDLAGSFSAEGDSAVGLQVALAAVAVAQESNELDAEAEAWQQAAHRHIALEAHSQARDCFVQAARLWASLLQWREQGHCLLGAFDCSLMAGVPETDDDSLHEAYSLLLGVNDAHAAAYACWRMGQRAYADLRSLDALEFFAQARGLAGDDIDLVLLVNDSEADVLMAMNRYCCAIPLLWQAFDLSDTARGDSIPHYEAWRLVRAIRHSGDQRQALTMAQDFLATLQAVGCRDADAIGSFQFEYAQCLRVLGHSTQSLAAMRKAWHHLKVSENTSLMHECEGALAEFGIPESVTGSLCSHQSGGVPGASPTSGKEAS